MGLFRYLGNSANGTVLYSFLEQGFCIRLCLTFLRYDEAVFTRYETIGIRANRDADAAANTDFWINSCRHMQKKDAPTLR